MVPYSPITISGHNSTNTASNRFLNAECYGSGNFFESLWQVSDPTDPILWRIRKSQVLPLGSAVTFPPTLTRPSPELEFELGMTRKGICMAFFVIYSHSSGASVPLLFCHVSFYERRSIYEGPNLELNVGERTPQSGLQHVRNGQTPIQFPKCGFSPDIKAAFGLAQCELRISSIFLRSITLRRSLQRTPDKFR